VTSRPRGFGLWQEAHKDYEVEFVYLARGVLAGLVGVTAGAVVLEPWAAVICGGIAAWVFYGAETVV
jgi:ammonia channel protein AmtB